MSKVQITIEFGKVARDEGMNRAVDNANVTTPKWSDLVYDAFHEYVRSLKKYTKFQTEDFREWLGDRIAEPPSKRAFGAITMRAARAGIIKHVGYAHVKNPKAHRANSAVWVAA